jgi:hypothetical protein
MIAALAVAVLAVGCTSIEHGKGAPDLKAQLLTVAELPAGWSIDNSNSGGDNTSTPSCLQRLDSELHANAKADASFVKGSDFPWLNQGIAYFGDDATASAKLSTIAGIPQWLYRPVLHVRRTQGHWIDGDDVVSQLR